MDAILNCALFVFAAMAIAIVAAVLAFPLRRGDYDRGEWTEYMEDDDD